MDVNVSRNNRPLKVEDCDDYNPWIAEDASAFLKYNCPECNFSNKTLQLFTEHALENHIKSKVFFTPENLAEQFKLDIIKNEDPEYFAYECLTIENVEKVFSEQIAIVCAACKVCRYQRNM